MSSKKVVELGNKFEKKIAQQNNSEQQLVKSNLENFKKYLSYLQSGPGGFQMLTPSEIDKYLQELNNQTLKQERLEGLNSLLKMCADWYLEISKLLQ